MSNTVKVKRENMNMPGLHEGDISPSFLWSRKQGDHRYCNICEQKWKRCWLHIVDSHIAFRKVKTSKSIMTQHKRTFCICSEQTRHCHCPIESTQTNKCRVRSIITIVYVVYLDNKSQNPFMICVIMTMGKFPFTKISGFKISVHKSKKFPYLTVKSLNTAKYDPLSVLTILGYILPNMQLTWISYMLMTT